MNKCFVTKLNGSSNNPELLRLGEMRMKILKVSNPTEHTQCFSLSVNKAVTLEIVSDGYFTDKTLTENKGKNITLNVGANDIWVNGNSDVEIAILDKYSLTRITTYYKNELPDKVYGDNIKLNLSDLKYSNNLTILDLSHAQVSGDIANLKDCASFVSLNLSNTQVSGDITNFKNLTALTTLSLYNTKVSGDIANLKNLTLLTYLSLDNTKVSGNIGELRGLTKCTNISLKGSTFTGDLSLIPSSCTFISFNNNKNTVLSWTNRPSTSKILAIEGNAKITNVDKMLQDQAQCQVGFTESSSSWYKAISCVGTRTSESDTAVATLQQKGYTVSITPA